MDGNRFDQLAKSVSRGASRRAVLRALLGFGSTGLIGSVIARESDARTAGSRRPLSPPPPPQPTPTPSPSPTPSPTPEPCQGFACGGDCCDDEFQCCGGDCCPAGWACLTRWYGGEFDGIEEETCCPIPNLCDAEWDRCCNDGEECCSVDACCAGSCFDPGGGGPHQNGDPSCCPPGGTICSGDAASLCCQGEEPDCCVQSGVPVCIDRTIQCCSRDDCPGLFPGTHLGCWQCLENVCVPEPAGTPGECGTCHECGDQATCQVVPQGTSCPDASFSRLCCDGICCQPCHVCDPTSGLCAPIQCPVCHRCNPLSGACVFDCGENEDANGNRVDCCGDDRCNFATGICCRRQLDSCTSSSQCCGIDGRPPCCGEICHVTTGCPTGGQAGMCDIDTILGPGLFINCI
jgi:hypothetical protein